MTTAIEICNLALGMIGKPSINDFNEATAEAREANRFYDPVRRSALQSSDWTFARTRTKLAKVDPSFEERWNFTYMRPNDCLQARRIVHPRFDPRQNPRPIPFEVREGRIFTNLPDAQLEYTRDLTDTTKFSPLMVDLMQAMLAFRFARALTRSTRLTAEMKEEAREALSNAISADAAQDLDRYTYDADAMVDRHHDRPHPFWGRD